MDLNEFGEFGHSIKEGHLRSFADEVRLDREEQEKDEAFDRAREEAARPLGMVQALVGEGRRTAPPTLEGVPGPQFCDFPIKSPDEDISAKLRIECDDFVIPIYQFSLVLLSEGGEATTWPIGALSSMWADNHVQDSYGFRSYSHPQDELNNNDDNARLLLSAIEEAHELAFADQVDDSDLPEPGAG